MDLNTATKLIRPSHEEHIPENWTADSAWVAGGTWLYSEPQEHLNTLIDLSRLPWDTLSINNEGLTIGATCRIIQLDGLKTPNDWTSAPLISICCRALLASFKIWNEATIGGNICLGLPAGAMISLCVALDGTCTLWPRKKEPRTMKVADLVVGENETELMEGELLRSIFIPCSSFKRRFVCRRSTYSEQGRSMIFLIATVDPTNDEFVLTVTASTNKPFQFRFSNVVSFNEVKKAMDSTIMDSDYLVDCYRSPEYRKHMTYYFAEEICNELLKS